MTGVLAAFAAYEASKGEARATARAIRFRAQARLGREIEAERKAGMRQEAIAARLGHTREQIRRYESAWRMWQKMHPEDDLAAAS